MIIFTNKTTGELNSAIVRFKKIIITSTVHFVSEKKLYYPMSVLLLKKLPSFSLYACRNDWWLPVSISQFITGLFCRKMFGGTDYQYWINSVSGCGR